MDTTITTEPAGKRARNSSVVLTDRMCEKRVVKRAKIYDRKCLRSRRAGRLLCGYRLSCPVGAPILL